MGHRKDALAVRRRLRPANFKFGSKDVDPIFIVENSLYVAVYPGQAALHSVVLTPATSLDQILSVVAKDAGLTVKTTEELKGKALSHRDLGAGLRAPRCHQGLLLVELRTSDGRSQDATAHCRVQSAMGLRTDLRFTRPTRARSDAPGAAR